MNRTVIESALILNEREARAARATLEKVSSAVGPTASIDKARLGLSATVIERHRKAVNAVATDLSVALAQYEKAKQGDYAELLESWRGEPGIALVVARIAQGMSQAALAKHLGLKEQQIQRYEADRYRSISLSNYRRFAHALGVQLRASISTADSRTIHRAFSRETAFDEQSQAKVLRHALANAWFDEEPPNSTGLADYIRESIDRFGNPALLRTGMRRLDLTNDVSLAAWRARVIKVAQAEPDLSSQFDPLDIGWLAELVKLSVLPDGPRLAQQLLSDRGIRLIIERQIPGLELDGAAMIVDRVPVVALTLRHDRIDNFWFTLLHELAHIFLHYRMGLAAGFFDDLESEDDDAVEKEADEFAGSALIPDELWKLSPARISRAPEPIEAFARQLGIHPAIVFGRVRKERKNYKIFSDRVGNGGIRPLFGVK